MVILSQIDLKLEKLVINRYKSVCSIGIRGASPCVLEIASGFLKRN